MKHGLSQTILSQQPRRVRARFGFDVAHHTGPLDHLRGKQVLVIADAQNLDHSARDLGFRLSWAGLGMRLKDASARAWLHVVFSRLPDETRRWEYYADCGWKPHAKNCRWVNRNGIQQRDANADNHVAFLAGYLAGRLPIDWVVVATGDGELGLDLAECVRNIPSSPSIATLSLAGSTAGRLDARICDLVDVNIEVGRDVLRPFAGTSAAS